MVEVVPPTERRCDRCGRAERWDDDAGTWVLASDDDERRGRAFCLHDWDINGSYNPFDE